MIPKDWPDSLITVLCSSLRERRKELGLTIYRVSQSSGVSQQAIANYEKNLRHPTIVCLVKVSLALGVKPSDLMADAEKHTGLSTVVLQPSKGD